MYHNSIGNLRDIALPIQHVTHRHRICGTPLGLIFPLGKISTDLGHLNKRRLKVVKSNKTVERISESSCRELFASS